MYKMFILLLVSFVFLTGCSVNVIDNDSVNTIIKTVLYKETKLNNVSFEGFSLYLPQGTKIVDKTDYNLKIKDNKYYYYLYVDTIAYHYKTRNMINLPSDHFYTSELKNKENFGYIDISLKDDKYFIVVMYNYAKLEGYVLKDDLSNSLETISMILSSIKYNEKIISAYLSTNKEISKEEKFDIFSSKKENDSFLTYEKEYGVYVDPNKDKKDEDIIDLQKSN